MFEALAKFKAAATWVVLGTASSMTIAHAGLVKNGDFNQIGPTNPVIFSLPGQTSAWSAAAYWQQFRSVPQSAILTEVKPIGIGLTHMLHIEDVGYTSPAGTGNSVGQTFVANQCVTATFSILVKKGKVTGGLLHTNGAYAASPTPVFQSNSNWQPYAQYSYWAVNAIRFETLEGPADYSIPDVAVINPCITTVVFTDMGNYLGYDPFWKQKDPCGPVEKIRVTNNSAVTVQGPIHVLLQDLPQGRTVVNPDGDYMGTPFVTLTSQSLAPCESEVVAIQFNAERSGEVPTFRVRIGSLEIK